MTQTEYTRTASNLSQCDAILKELQEAFPSAVSMPLLGEKSGSRNVHSRISDLRKHWEIECVVERQGHACKSYYRLLSLNSNSRQ